jgi:hypothetical protein
LAVAKTIFMNDNPYQILDDILSVIPAETPLSRFEISVSLLKIDENYDLTYLTQAIDKLYNEGYLTSKIITENRYNKEMPHYKLTYEAFLLIKDGNYSKMKERDISKETELFTIQQKQEKYNKSIKNLTYWIAGGTIVACLYTLLQIAVWLHQHHYFYYNFCKNIWTHF